MYSNSIFNCTDSSGDWFLPLISKSHVFSLNCILSVSFKFSILSHSFINNYLLDYARHRVGHLHNGGIFVTLIVVVQK